MLALNVEVSKDCHVTVVGCYRYLTALSETLVSFTNCMTKIKFREVIVVGNLNWVWFKPASDDVKTYCETMSLTLTNAPS